MSKITNQFLRKALTLTLTLILIIMQIFLIPVFSYAQDPVPPEPIFNTIATEYQGTQNADIELLNVVDGASKLEITGVTTAVYQDGGIGIINFKIGFDQDITDPSYYSNTLSFVDYTDTAQFSANQGTLSSTNGNLIPVDLTCTNDITLSYGDGTNTTIHWRPEVSAEVLSTAMIDNPFINGEGIIHVSIDDYVGDKGDITLELSDGSTTLILPCVSIASEQIDGVSKKLLTFDYAEANSILNDVNYHETTLNSKLIYNVYSDETIEYQQALETVTIDNQLPQLYAYIDRTEMFEGVNYKVVRIQFNDKVLTDTLVGINSGDFELRVDPSVEGMICTLKCVSSSEPDPYFYEQMDLYFPLDTYAGEYLLVRNISDVAGNTISEAIVTINTLPMFDIDSTSITEGQTPLIKLLNIDSTDQQIVVQGTSMQEFDPFSSTVESVNFDLTFNYDGTDWVQTVQFIDKEDAQFTIDGVTGSYTSVNGDLIPVDLLVTNDITLTYNGLSIDFNWNPLNSSKTEVKFNFVDDQNLPIQNIYIANIKLIPFDASTNDFLSNQVSTFYYYSDFDIIREFEPGQYKIASSEIEFIDSTKIQAYLNQIITIPEQTVDPYMLDIQIPASNITGIAQDNLGDVVTDIILVVNDNYLNSDPWIRRNYEIELYPSPTDGSFSTYLTPGSYTVLGKVDISGMQVPVNDPVQFTVNETGTNDIGIITFQKENVIGTIVDSTGTGVSRPYIKVYTTTGDIVDFFSGDENGNFSIYLPDGEYVLSKVSVEHLYDYNGSLYVVDIPFTVSGGAVANNIDGINPIANITLPTPNLEIIFNENGQLYASYLDTDDWWAGKEVCAGILLDNGTKAELIYLETKTGIVKIYYPNLTSCVLTSVDTWEDTDYSSHNYDNLNINLNIDPNTNYTGTDAYVIDIAQLDTNNVASVSISSSTNSVLVGNKINLTATAVYSDNSNENVTSKASWSSSDENVAKVVKGVVTGLAKGKATITVTYGEATHTITISSLIPKHPLLSSNDTGDQDQPTDEEQEETGEEVNEENLEDDTTPSEDENIEVNTEEGSVAIGEENETIEETQLEDGTTVSELTLNEEEVIEVINNQEVNQLSIELSENHANLDVSFSDDVVSSLQEKGDDSTLVIKSSIAEYELPTAVLELDRLREELGTDDITFNVTIRQPSHQVTNRIEQKANQSNMQLLAEPIEFKLEASTGGKTIEIASFSTNYAVRKIVLSQDVDVNSAVGVVYDEETDTYVHTPTKFEIDENGNLVAYIKRKGNSIYTVIQNNRTFNDISNHWAKENIEILASKLIINGVNKTEFAPNAMITRAQFAALIVRALGLDSNEVVDKGFADISENNWYYNAVNTAAQEGIVTGYPSDNTFRPLNPVSRQEMAVMIVRALKVAGKNGDINALDKYYQLSKFVDKTGVANWAEDSVAIAVREGIITGRTASTFAPKQNAKRAEAATMLLRMLRTVDFIN